MWSYKYDYRDAHNFGAASTAMGFIEMCLFWFWMFS